jgi:BMFP domain-containing protein YqiC
MFENYLIKKALDIGFNQAKDIAKKIVSKKAGNLHATREDVEEALNLHIRSIKNWSDSISFNDLKESKHTTDVFIELDLFVYPRRIRIDQSEMIKSIPLREIFDRSYHHFVLLGHPGAGKTTSMKYICQLLLHDEEFQKERFSFPILIKFRDLNSEKITSESTLILDQIFKILNLNVSFPIVAEKEDLRRINEIAQSRESVVINFLEELKVLLILDGFDELVSSNFRDIAIKEITRLATLLNRCTMIITSRTGDFKYNIDHTDQYELCPLQKKQVESFALKWLKDKEKAADFLTKVYNSPFADTAIRPLSLAHLCAIYERIQDIPEKPKTVYKKIVILLLEEWDQQRSVKRESKYAHFQVDRKYEFLCHLAYFLTKSLQTTVFTTNHLLYIFKQIHEEYGLKETEAQLVVNEIETHNGLFIQSGFDQYEFAHKSLQEFLAAEYLVKLPSIPENWKILSSIPNELAIAVAISSSPTSYFIELIVHRLRDKDLSEAFVRSFLSRLLIEKPDFRKSVWLDLALLILYTKFIEYNVKYKLFNDPVFKDLEKVIDMLHTKSIDTILSCYETEHVYEGGGGNNLYKMILVRKLSGPEVKSLTDSFPQTLFVRKSLLSKDKQFNAR